MSFRIIRFRLLADLPLEIAAGGTTYRLEVAQVPVSSLWRRRASYPAGSWLCAYAASEAKLRGMVYQDGLKPAAGMVRTIFDRPVADRRAVVVR